MDKIYQSQRMRLGCVRTVKSNSVNDILICRDLNSAAGALYTVLAIKDHAVVRLCLEAFRSAGSAGEKACVDSFSDQGLFCMVFEYKQERPLEDFYTGGFYSLNECEAICGSVIIACMTAGLPYPLLYLALRQGQLNLAKDHTVYLGWQIDLSELDLSRTERDCAVECAQILRDLLSAKAAQKAYSYRLLEKKIGRKSYDSFTELYKDIQIAAAPEKRRGIRKRLTAWLARQQDTIFRILLIVCTVLVVIVLASLLCQLIFGDVPWLRLLFNGFKTIGTESLVG
ncbi:MAG: hypothetical protein LUE24_05910 [Lachnospiraceae bacterium]|nr:hypothetical protein [Lachnospiraceae bacterium]